MTKHRAGGLAVLAFLASCATFDVARADCNEDIGVFMKKRDAVLLELKAMASGGKGKEQKQLDPAAACPKFKTLAAILGQTLAYMAKNKEWCGIPDQVLAGAKAQQGQFATTANRACGMAAQMKKQQEQGGPLGAQQVQKLPAGPL